MGETIKQCCGHLGVAEDAGPFAEAEVCGDNDAGAFVEFAQKMEEQGTAGGTERQVSQLVQDHEVGFHQRLGDLASLALGLFLLQRVDQLDRREEAHALAVMLDGTRYWHMRCMTPRAGRIKAG